MGIATDCNSVIQHQPAWFLAKVHPTLREKGAHRHRAVDAQKGVDSWSRHLALRPRRLGKVVGHDFLLMSFGSDRCSQHLLNMTPRITAAPRMPVLTFTPKAPLADGKFSVRLLTEGRKWTVGSMRMEEAGSKTTPSRASADSGLGAMGQTIPNFLPPSPPSQLL